MLQENIYSERQETRVSWRFSGKLQGTHLRCPTSLDRASRNVTQGVHSFWRSSTWYQSLTCECIYIYIIPFFVRIHNIYIYIYIRIRTTCVYIYIYTWMPGAFKHFMFGPSLNHSVPPCPKRRRQSQGGCGPNSSDSGGKKAAIWEEYNPLEWKKLYPLYNYIISIWERGKKVDIIQKNGWHVSFPDPSLAFCDVSVFHFLRWRGSGAEKSQLAMNCGSTVQAFGVCVCVFTQWNIS